MLCLLIDESELLGWSRRGQPPGNTAPVAVADTVTVVRGLGPVSVPALANDIDLEGGSLTLVSAIAAFGTATAEPDGTITYTPPADAAITTDTVTYEIADSADARATGQIAVTITAPEVSIAIRPDNTLHVTAGTAPVTITVTEPAGFAGTYEVDLAGLAAGPINLVTPVIAGILETGAVLTAAEGLWINDAAAGTPVQSWQWQRGGVDIPGAAGPAYTVRVGDSAGGLRAIETLSDAFGSRSAASDVQGSFTPADDAALTGWWDADAPATITGTGGAVSAWAARIGGATLVQTTSSRQPTTGTRVLNGRNVLDFDGGDHLAQTIALPASGNVAFHAVIVIDGTASAFEAVLSVDATNDFQIDANAVAQFDGRFNATGIGSSVAFAGGPFAGAMILSVVCDFTGAGMIEVFVGGQSRATTAYVTPLDAAAAIHLMTNRSRNAWVNGAVAEVVVTGNVANREAHHGYLAEKWGLV